MADQLCDSQSGRGAILALHLGSHQGTGPVVSSAVSRWGWTRWNEDAGPRRSLLNRIVPWSSPARGPASHNVSSRTGY